MQARPAGEPVGHTTSTYSSSAKPSSCCAQEGSGGPENMRTLKHLPVNEWPEADREAFRAAYEPGDVFDGTAGPGAQCRQASALPHMLPRRGAGSGCLQPSL